MRRAARYTVTGATAASSLETRMDAGFQPRFFAVTANSDVTAKTKCMSLDKFLPADLLSTWRASPLRQNKWGEAEDYHGRLEKFRAALAKNARGAPVQGVDDSRQKGASQNSFCMRR